MATDMQFSFSYIHYLMEKRASYSMEEVKAKFVLTDRRQCIILKTFLRSKIRQKPLFHLNMEKA